MVIEGVSASFGGRGKICVSKKEANIKKTNAYMF